MAVLYSIRYSPWSLLARWALAYHDTPYKASEYLTLITEWKLRFILRDFFGRISAPLLIDDRGNALRDSLEISRWSGKQKGPNCQGDLFADFDSETIELWNLRSAQVLNYGRNQNFKKLVTNDEAIMLMLPKHMRSLGSLGVMIGRFMVKRVQKKYIAEPGGEDLANAKSILTLLREALAKNGDYIMGSFSYADVVMAISLQVIMPSTAVFPMKTALMEAITVTSLKEEFADLGQWRDKIVERHYFDVMTGKCK
ncbi:hypothetical protein BSKO_04177 [Bryopsis sp. KO-2023]|nr:hypothetical protein BSKO_04177 [Bryopsis sp. KO-2023]